MTEVRKALFFEKQGSKTTDAVIIKSAPSFFS